MQRNIFSNSVPPPAEPTVGTNFGPPVNKSKYTGAGYSGMKGSVCFVLKFALPPFSPPLECNTGLKVFLGSKVPCALF